MTPKLRPYQEEYINQAKQALIDGYKAPCLVAPCGAGKSMIAGALTKMTADKGNYVLFIVHRKELCDQIEATFEWWKIPKDKYQVSMVQTVSRRLSKQTKPQLIITDEGHHGLASTYIKVYDYFSDVPRISITATPVRLSGKGLKDVNDKLIEIVNAKWLIENGFLAPYKYYAPNLIDTSVLKMGSNKDYSKNSVDAEMTKQAIYGDVVSHYKKLANGEQAIVYCHSIEASKRIIEEFESDGIQSEHIDAKTPKNERDDIIQRFKNGETKILSNVDLIGEGFDVPDCSTVIMMRPTKSLSLYIQQSMRGMRFKEGKTAIIIDHVGNVHEHGFPDDEREWSLKGNPNGQSEFKDDGTLKIKQCENCFAAYENTGSRECPFCGHEVELVEREMEMIKEIELEELKRHKAEVVLDYSSVNDCKDMQELSEFAKRKGYKAGWVYYQGKLKGWV